MMFQARVVGVFVAIMTLAMLAAWYSVAYTTCNRGPQGLMVFLRPRTFLKYLVQSDRPL